MPRVCAEVEEGMGLNGGGDGSPTGRRLVKKLGDAVQPGISCWGRPSYVERPDVMLLEVGRPSTGAKARGVATEESAFREGSDPALLCKTSHGPRRRPPSSCWSSGTGLAEPDRGEQLGDRSRLHGDKAGGGNEVDRSWAEDNEGGYGPIQKSCWMGFLCEGWGVRRSALMKLGAALRELGSGSR